MNQNSICCPRFEPALWDQTCRTWNHQLFIKAKVKTFFHVPLNYGIVMRELQKQIVAQQGEVIDHLFLTYSKNLWTMEIMACVHQPIAHYDSIILDGTYTFKVYEGPLSDVEAWKKAFTSYIEKLYHFKPSTIYIWYTTCPDCAKKYGKNYVVLLTKIA